MGLVSLFADAGQSTELVMEHMLEDNDSSYPLIAVPELFSGLEDATVQKLLAYAENGGSLLLTGANTCRIFEKASRAFTAEDAGGGLVTYGDMEYAAVQDALVFQAENAETVAVFSKNYREEARPFAVVLPYGSGKLALIGADVGLAYNTSAQYALRRLIEKTTALLYSPTARIEGALGLLELTLLEKDGKTMLQLVNANGSHVGKNHATWDMLPPVCDVRLSVEAAEGTQFLLQPEGRALVPEYRDGRAYLTIGNVEIHSIVEMIP